jgi:hypothetical protein
MRRTRSPCCARAATGHAAAAPPSNVMNSRRLIGHPCRGNPRYHIVEQKLSCAAQQILTADDRSWVRIDKLTVSITGPLCPRERR